MHTENLVEQLANALQKKQAFCATAESCTGGLIASTLTQRPGSSLWFDCGFVTYSNSAKQILLGVRAPTLAEHGAVSRETVIEMAEGALLNSKAYVTVAVSGIAGPEGGSIDKPVGTVWFAWAGQNHETLTQCQHLLGTRAEIRLACVDIAIQGFLTQIMSFL